VTLSSPLDQILPKRPDSKYTQVAVELLYWVVEDLLLLRIFLGELRVGRRGHAVRHEYVCEALLDGSVPFRVVADVLSGLWRGINGIRGRVGHGDVCSRLDRRNVEGSCE
jgi:hypothetical protein